MMTAIVATLIGPYETLSGFALVASPLWHCRPGLCGRDPTRSWDAGAITWATLGARPADPGRVGGITLLRGTFTHQYPAS